VFVVCWIRKIWGGRGGGGEMCGGGGGGGDEGIIEHGY